MNRPANRGYVELASLGAAAVKLLRWFPWSKLPPDVRLSRAQIVELCELDLTREPDRLALSIFLGLHNQLRPDAAATSAAPKRPKRGPRR